MKACLGIAALLLSASGAAAAPPLAPAGKWGLDHQPHRCVLQRAFGDAGTTYRLAIVPNPGRITEMLLISPKSARVADGAGEGNVTVSPGGKSFPGPVQTVTLDDGSSASRIHLDEAVVDLLPTISQIDVAIKGAPDVSLALPGMASASGALETCLQDEAIALGVDPAVKRHRALTPAARNAQLQHVGIDAYPAEAHGASGVSVALLTISADGRVTACTIAESSGNAALDKRMCEMGVRFRYPPEQDAAGKPVASWLMFATHWQAPG